MCRLRAEREHIWSRVENANGVVSYCAIPSSCALSSPNYRGKGEMRFCVVISKHVLYISVNHCIQICIAICKRNSKTSREDSAEGAGQCTEIERLSRFWRADDRYDPCFHLGSYTRD